MKVPLLVFFSKITANIKGKEIDEPQLEVIRNHIMCLIGLPSYHTINGTHRDFNDW